MRPTAEEVLRGIKANLLTIVFPALEDTYIRGQLQTMAMQLEAVASQWDGEAGRQVARSDALASLLNRCGAALMRTEQATWIALGEATIATAGARPVDVAVDLSLSSIYARQAQLGEALAGVLVAFEQIAARQPRSDILDLRREAYALLRAHLTGS